MKKIILSMAVLASALANAQVGINEENPKATLDIKGKTNNTSNKVEGLLIPRVNKEKALLMAGNSTPPEESTMIYVNDMTLTSTSNTTVEDITEKGYYFWNGAKWVKSSGSNGKLWKKLSDGNIKLVDSDLVDKIFYNKDGGYRLEPKNHIETTFWRSGFWPPSSPLPTGYITTTIAEKEAGYTTTYISESAHASKVPYNPSPEALANPQIITGALKSNSLVVDPTATQHTCGYLTLKNDLFIPAENTNDYDINYTVQNVSNHSGKGKVKNIMAVYNTGILGSPDSKADYIRGAYNQATSYSSQDLNVLEATYSYVSPRGNGNILLANGTRNIANLSDIFNSNIRRFAMTNNDFRIQTGANAPRGGIIDKLYGTYTSFTNTESSPVSIENIYGTYIGNVIGGTNGNYAIYTNAGQSSLGDVLEIRNDRWVANQETVFQFANGKSRKEIPTSQIIDQMNGAGDGGSNLVFKTQSPTPGTNTNLTLPTEKMVIGADGKVKINDLAGTGTRAVFADADGKLVIGSGSSNSGLWSNDATNNLVKLTNKSDGTTARTDANRVTIGDDGKITAKGFVGYNGAGIFPDYVFQKYYTGESTIKADYTFNTLEQVEHFVKQNGHLPGYTSAKEIAEKGLIDLGATQLTNVEKIEELYLHTIEQAKELQSKETRIEKLENEVSELKQMVKELMKK